MGFFDAPCTQDLAAAMGSLRGLVVLEVCGMAYLPQELSGLVQLQKIRWVREGGPVFFCVCGGGAQTMARQVRLVHWALYIGVRSNVRGLVVLGVCGMAYLPQELSGLVQLQKIRWGRGRVFHWGGEGLGRKEQDGWGWNMEWQVRLLAPLGPLVNTGQQQWGA